MDRYAIFVDVGYVVASAAELIGGSANRSLVHCDYSGLLGSLLQRTHEHSSLPPLRTYWYDASLSGQPEYDQLQVADLPGVRLRLGRLVRGEQKGVDSRIVRDLIVLARDRAISTAYVVAGDEDLCEGVQEAQDQGVRVVLAGVPGVNQSRLLVQQVDEELELDEAWWRQHFELTVEVPLTPPDEDAGAAAAGAFVTAVSTTEYNPAMAAAFESAAQRSGADAGALARITEEVQTFQQRAREVGAEFARYITAEWSPAEVDDLRRQVSDWRAPPHPPLRRRADADLLRFANPRLGLWERPELKIPVREGFWNEIRR